ncbi:MAG: hypothetical protein EXR66_07455 [Dehalococcoidia bacterium]|nr:hypothetical protein [Dehalococcoidia bacterium]
MATVGLLYPGAMGAAMGAAVTKRARVLWASEGRSAATAARAVRASLEDAAASSRWSRRAT